MSSVSSFSMEKTSWNWNDLVPLINKTSEKVSCFDNNKMENIHSTNFKNAITLATDIFYTFPYFASCVSFLLVFS
jgi:hypothetical protein